MVRIHANEFQSAENTTESWRFKHFIVKLKEKLAYDYMADVKLCKKMETLYIQWATHSEIADVLLHQEYIISQGITKQVISRILKDIMDSDTRKDIARKKGNKNLKHDSAIQKERGMKWWAMKNLPVDQAELMGKLSHSDKIDPDISKKIYMLRISRGIETLIKVWENEEEILTGSRDKILAILAKYLEYTYNIKKTPAAIRGIIDRERKRTNNGEEMTQEMPKELRELILQKYINLQEKWEKTFEENQKIYKTTAHWMIAYTEDVFGFKRTIQRFCLYLSEYRKSISDKKKE